MLKILEPIYNNLSPETQVYLKVLQTQTSFSPMCKSREPKVVCALDSKVYNCGFADRLRGMISGYAFAKANNLPFKIIHKDPFVLEDYLVPNLYDWKADEEDAKLNFWTSKISICLNDLQNVPLLKHTTTRPIYYYSNNDLIELINKQYKCEYIYSSLFKELFKPSALLQEHIEQVKSDLSFDYVSASFRFMNLIGDKFEGSKPALPEAQRTQLIDECLMRIHQIHEANGNCKLLVTADSMIFLDLVKDIPFVCIIPGKTGHSGHKGNGSQDVTLKTFLDFIMISQAKKAYLVKGPGMFNSHFASSAAQTTGIPFERIIFD